MNYIITVVHYTIIIMIINIRINHYILTIMIMIISIIDYIYTIVLFIISIIIYFYTIVNIIIINKNDIHNSNFYNINTMNVYRITNFLFHYNIIFIIKYKNSKNYYYIDIINIIVI